MEFYQTLSDDNIYSFSKYRKIPNNIIYIPIPKIGYSAKEIPCTYKEHRRIKPCLGKKS